jgi:hypothetical protein
MRELQMAGVTAAAQRTFRVQTQGAFEELRRIESEISKWNHDEEAAKVNPGAADTHIQELERRRAVVVQRIEDARAAALGGGFAPSSSATSGSSTGRTKTTADAIKAAGQARGWSETKIQQAINRARARGDLQ